MRTSVRHGPSNVHPASFGGEVGLLHSAPDGNVAAREADTPMTTTLTGHAHQTWTAHASSRLVDRVSKAHDASHYLLVPRTVITAETAAEVADVMGEARNAGRHITFRSGGTSLSGQALSSDILVDVRGRFRGVTVLDGGRRVRCQPGATVRAVNAHLARFGSKLGPDPASEIACTIGGVVANNSSGMSCGTQFNTYRTLDSMVFVLPSGTRIDTAEPDADQQLRRREPELHERLGVLRDRILANPDSVARIAHQYAMKNTMGYGLNSFVDFHEPVHILEHLIIGSEGTLAFVAEATFRTVPIHRFASTALLIVPEMAMATDALTALLAGGATALELMDAASLRVVQQYPEASEELAALAVQRHAGLLVEATADSAEELDEMQSALDDVMAGLPIDDPPTFTTDAVRRANIWQLRKGLYTSVAGARPSGTTNLLEDVAVPVADLTATIDDLSHAFGAHGYDDAVVFGHAKDGNIHFMINPDLADPAQVEAYRAFTEDMVATVLGHDGTLKAEHGTGRIMAPFVRRQFGDELYSVMQEVKRATDPTGVLNPGTLLNEDPDSYLEHLKLPAAVSPMVDRCVECGYCEPTCPSKDLTTTPRRRIALLRAIEQADDATAAELRRAYDYEAVDTCAVDSLCSRACPVGIDTGVFMKTFRAARHGERTQKTAAAIADHWAGSVSALRGALGVAEIVPGPLKLAATRAVRAVAPKDWIPEVGRDLPGPGARRTAPRNPADASFVFFSSCMGSLFAPEGPHDPGAAEAFLALTDAAGLAARVPEDLPGLCCGTPWVSKGLTQGAQTMARALFDSLWEATDHARLPLVCDASSCSHGLLEVAHLLDADPATASEAARWRTITILDAVTYVAREVLPRIHPTHRLNRVVVHPACSLIHLGAVDDLVACARAVADEVYVPIEAGCCAFAGDRGLLHPELTASATRMEAHEVATHGPFDAYASANRTCEMGMSRATGQDYRHVLELLAEAL